jgi:ABC-2 type transport system ATP-binding protein
VITVAGVSKMFGLVRALNEIDLDVGPGVCGLLGPNGSGKSTLLKLIAGQLRPDTGTVRLLGQDPFSTPTALRQLGLCPEQDRFYEDLSGFEFVEALTRLHGFPAESARKTTRFALERVGMSRDGLKRMSDMSRGMRQRVKIAQAIAHDPRVVLLDEPLNGADPVARADLIRLVRSLGDEGRCVVVSSHVLHEVESMTHRVVLVRFGRMRAQGDFSAICASSSRTARTGSASSSTRRAPGNSPPRMVALTHVHDGPRRTARPASRSPRTQLDAACHDVPDTAAATRPRADRSIHLAGRGPREPLPLPDAR